MAGYVMNLMKKRKKKVLFYDNWMLHPSSSMFPIHFMFQILLFCNYYYLKKKKNSNSIFFIYSLKNKQIQNIL